MTWALDAPLRISQYVHTSWTVRDGYPLGLVFAMAQTRDGYLWLGGSNGLSRFDGQRFAPWQPPDGEQLPSQPYSLLVSRDGTLWIGTFDGLVSWDGKRLAHHPGIDSGFVTSLLEDRDGTIWAGVLADKGQLCAVRGAKVECHAEGGAFGKFVWSVAQDASGTVWAGTDSGLWRWQPGPSHRLAMPGKRLGDLITTSDGELMVGIRGGGLQRVSGDRFEPYPIAPVSQPGETLADRAVDSNKLLRDRDGGIWVGTDGHGILLVQDGKAERFTYADGLSGDIACSFFEDREGNIWYASEKGLDRFRKPPVVTVSVREGLPNDKTRSIVSTAEGDLWVATEDGLARWRDGRFTVYRERDGLPGAHIQSLHLDAAGRLWVSTNAGLAYRSGERFVSLHGVPGSEIYSLGDDGAGTLWLSSNEGLARVSGGRLVENIPWPSLGRTQQAKVVLPAQGGVWMGFWHRGGVVFFRDGKVQASYSRAEGLGAGHVAGLRLARDGAVWAATESGGLSRIKDGRISTLTVDNGLPCNAIHWSMEDKHGALWMYTACGLMRVPREDIEGWIHDPRRRVRPQVWGGADGVTTIAVTPAYFNPPVALGRDGKLWFVGGDGIQMIDPDHLSFNALPPPVHIEGLVADRKPFRAVNGLRLPPMVRDVTIDFTALSLVDPKNVRFRYRLTGYDNDWQDTLERRQAIYTNLPPGKYRFSVKAANNSGVWNEEGAQLDFSIEPALYQTTWFRIVAGVAAATLLWAGFQVRLRQLRREQQRLQEVINEIPAMAFSINPDGSRDLVNQRWLDYTGQSEGIGWESAIHPADVEVHLSKWRSALASGEPFENEARHRNSKGEYRWFLVQAVPLRDKHRRIVKWYGTLTDIEERKRAEAEAERLRRLEAHLAHTNRLSMLGELTASLAHEINQPIAAVMVSAGAGLRWLERGEPDVQGARDAIARIKADGKRAADIIAGLKAFYRKGGPTQRERVDVNAVVREMLVLLRHEAQQHRVVMKTDLAAEPATVRADRVQLQQVLMNLMVNGIEAMGEAGGELTVRTRLEGDQVCVSVSDTGVGIPADKLEQVFNAFVTSKATGTGMGLAISRTLVESHGGKLWAESGQSGGATFHFTLAVAGDSSEGQAS